MATAASASTTTCSPPSSSSWRWPSWPTGARCGSAPACCAGTRSGMPVKRILAGVYSLVLVAVLWELVARSGLVPFFFLPPLSTIAVTFWGQVADGTLVQETLLTIFRAAAGFAIAVVVGITLGIAMARFRTVHWFFDPIVAVGMSVPSLTLVPAFILWFGIGHESKILLVALSCVWSMTVSTYN